MKNKIHLTTLFLFVLAMTLSPLNLFASDASYPSWGIDSDGHNVWTAGCIDLFVDSTCTHDAGTVTNEYCEEDGVTLRETYTNAADEASCGKWFSDAIHCPAECSGAGYPGGYCKQYDGLCSGQGSARCVCLDNNGRTVCPGGLIDGAC